jgi:MFS family permease
MTRLATAPRSRPRPHQLQPRTEPAKSPGTSQFAYGRPFWLTYASNLLVVIAIALLFRYADFVQLLGGTEFHLGWIVGVGMVGSLFMRLALGSCIDTYGTKLVWLGSTVLFAATCFAHLTITSHSGVAIYVLRILYCCAMAGIAGASMTFVSKPVPTARIAELIGMLGTSGFLGNVTGTLLGDLLLGSVTIERHQVTLMFVTAGILGTLSFPFVWLATRAEKPCAPAPRVSLFSLLRRYASPAVLIVVVGMGMGLGLPSVFLRTYAAALDIPRIGLFFLIYAGSAIITRIVTRRWPERFGARPLILLGAAGVVASIVLFLPVRSEWHMILPALGFGASHAILWPAVVAAGNATFPVRHRGLATVLVLAACDVGQLTGAPTAGAILRYSQPAGLPPYPTMFLTMAGLLVMATVCYAAMTRRGRAKGPTAGNQ